MAVAAHCRRRGYKILHGHGSLRHSCHLTGRYPQAQTREPWAGLPWPAQRWWAWSCDGQKNRRYAAWVETSPQYVWVQVKGAARPIELGTAGLRNVDGLLEKVKEKVKPQLDAVPVNNLTLYLSEAAKHGNAQALRPDMMISSFQGGQDVENALYVHYEELVAGAAASGTGAQGVPPHETVEAGIVVGQYKLPKLPELTRDLIQREDAIETMAAYIRSSIAGENRGTPDQKFPLLGSSGMKGIGKTSMLLHGCLKTVPELEGMSVQASYVTFNGQGNARGHFNDSLRHQGEPPSHAQAFGHVLLRLSGVSPELAHQLPFCASLRLYRKMLGIHEAETSLVLFVDEIGSVGDEKAEDLLHELMAEMDGRNGKLVFVFTHIRQDVLNTQTTGSGRQVIPLELAALPVNTWEKAFKDEEMAIKAKKAASTIPGIHQLFLSCCGHPRSIFDGLPEAFQAPHLLRGADIDVADARRKIVDKCKFVDLNHEALGARIQQWFNFLEGDGEKQLKRDGLLLTIEHHRQEVQFFLPMVMQFWAMKGKSAMAHHLHQAYVNDAVLGPDSEKRMEAVMYHYEAVLRIAIRGHAFPLRDFYSASKHIGEKFRNHQVEALVPAGQELVESVKSFNNDTRGMEYVLELLKLGRIVVSRAHSEIGVEYLAPFRKVDSQELIVACVQCKFVGERVNWKDVKKKMRTAMAPLTAKRIECFPVVYTTSDRTRLTQATQKEDDGVYFLESDIFEFTRKLGILRLHTQKLGQQMEKTHPWLKRAAATGDGEASEHGMTD